MTGILGIIAGVLHLSVPSYALRLVRHFGAHRVGWFVTGAFVLLALLHLVVQWQPFGVALPDFTLNLMLAVGAVLLLVGMGHLETVCRERDERLQREERLRQELQQQAANDTSFLVKTNLELQDDIARRALAEKKLAVAEAHYRSLFFETPQPIWIFDVCTLQLLTANRAALYQFGFSLDEFTTLTARHLLPREELARLDQDLLRPCAEAESRGTWRHQHREGNVFEVEITALDVDYSGCSARMILAQEVSGRERQAGKARERNGTDLMARIAQGAAGQFGPLFARIEKTADCLLPRLAADPKSAEQLKQILAAGTRGTVLARQLIGVSRQHALTPEVLDVNALIRNLNHTLTRLAGDAITVQHAYGSELSPVLADARVLEQIVIQLVSNAHVAMPSGGTVTLETAMVHLEDSNVPDECTSGRFIRLTVRDNGRGMELEVQARVFEPFFTSGDPGRCAGLGLPSARGLIAQQGGWMEFSSEVGTGTEFRVFLPCAPAHAVLAHRQARAARPLDRGTIMLVEPDERARGLARFVLNRNGYRVVEADSGSIALVLWQSQSSKVNLLITSLELPGDINGSALAQQLCESKPGLKLAFTAGRSPDESEARCKSQLPGNVPFISKPFHPERLLQQVEHCLADTTNSAG